MFNDLRNYETAEVDIPAIERSTILRLVSFVGYILLLVISLVFSGIGINRSGKIATFRSLEASTYWNEFQEVTVRQTLLRMHVQSVAILTAVEPSTDSVRKKIYQRLDLNMKEVARLESDPGSRGRKELRAKAESAEHDRDTAFCQSGSFGIAYAILQVAIALAAISLVLASLPMLWLSGLIGLAGMVFTLNGFVSFMAQYRFMCASYLAF